MADPDRMIRVDEDDPRRCQGQAKHGQCKFQAVEGGKYCWQHGGAIEAKSQEKERLYNLHLTKFRTQAARLSSSPAILKLHDEIGVSRVILETLVNKCEGDSDIITWMPQIDKSVNTISKLVKDCQYIEAKIGNLLDRTTLMNFASGVIDIICEHVEDDELKQIIAFQIVTLAEGLKNDD